MAATTFQLPDAHDPRAGATALGVALAGVACPVPFVMPVAAIRIAAEGATRRARAARLIGRLTIAVQALAIVAAVVLLAR